MKQQNVVEEVVDQLKYFWSHRKGQEVRAAIQDVIKEKYKEGKRPLIIDSSKKEDTWTFIISLPPAAGFLEFQKLTILFQDASGGSVHISKRGKAVIMEVMTEEPKKSYP